MAANDDDKFLEMMFRVYNIEMRAQVHDIHSQSREEARETVVQIKDRFDYYLRTIKGNDSDYTWQKFFGPFAKALGLILDEYPDLVDELYYGRTLLGESMYVFTYHDDYRYMLLQRGASLGTVDSDGRTAAMYAACVGRLQFVKMAAARKVDFNARDNDGETIFHQIFYDNSIIDYGFAVLDFLLSLKLDANGLDNDGFSPLAHMLVQRIITEEGTKTMEAVKYFTFGNDEYRQKSVNAMVQAYERGLRPIMPVQYRKHAQQMLQSLMQFADNPEVIQQMILYLNQEPVLETNAGQAASSNQSGLYLAI